MNYATIKWTDVANGPGVRVSLFVSGCTHRCEGCFNPEAWDFQYGQPYTTEVENKILDGLAPSYIKGLSLLGGEPFEPANQRALLPLLRRMREKYPDKTVWCYSRWTASCGRRAAPGASAPTSCSASSTCWWTASLCRRKRIWPCGSAARPTSGSSTCRRASAPTPSSRGAGWTPSNPSQNNRKPAVFGRRTP